MSTMNSLLLGVAGFAFLLCLIPTLIAFKRRHKDRKAILVLSILFGWLPFAWTIGLVWSIRGEGLGQGRSYRSGTSRVA
jgi:hypothetical protein